jgi:hypothetical protein
MASSSSTTVTASSLSSDPETVTSLTAKTSNPGKAVEKLFKREGLLYSLWRVIIYLLEELGVKASTKIHDDYSNVDLDKVASRGRFPYRPSDLFLKVSFFNWSVG